MKHVSILSSSSDHLWWSFGPSLGNKILRSSLFPVTPTFGPGLDLGVSVSMRPPTAADNLSNLALEIRSGAVDGTVLNVFYAATITKLLAAAASTSRGWVVDLRSLFLIPVSAAIITPGIVAFAPHTTSKQLNYTSIDATKCSCSRWEMPW